MTRSRSISAGAFAAAVLIALLLASGCATTVAGSAEPPGTTAASGTAGLPGAGHPSQPVGGSSSAPTTTGTRTPIPTPKPTMGMGTGTGTADSLTPQQFFATVTTAGKTITSVTGTMSLKGTFNGSQMSESGPIKATYANGALQAMDLQLSMTVQGQNLKISLRTVGDAAFIGGSSVMTALGAPAAGKTWARLDKNSPDEHLAALGSVLDSALAFGKNGAIPATIETAKKVTKIGPEKIGALATTKYEVAMPPPAAGGSGTTSVTDSGSTTSYWLDDRNRVVKTSSISGRQGIDLDLVYTVDSFDRPLRIDRPSPADVYAP